MKIKLKVTDGGRQSSGFFQERRDCTVRSLANAADIPYSEAHAIAKAAGRTNGHGYHTSLILKVAERRGVFTFTQIELPVYLSNGNGQLPTLASVVQHFRDGRYIVVTRNHAMALVDGVIHDTGLVGARSRVKFVYRIQPTEPVKVAPITQPQVNELWERLNRLEARL